MTLLLSFIIFISFSESIVFILSYPVARLLARACLVTEDASPGFASDLPKMRPVVVDED